MKRVYLGIFSKRAGLGTGSYRSCNSRYHSSCKTGSVWYFLKYLLIRLLSTLTALIILCSGINIPYGSYRRRTDYSGIYLNLRWMGIHLHSHCTLLLCILHDQLGTLRLSLYRISLEQKRISFLMIVYSLVAIIVATVDLGLLWSIAEAFNGLMSIPNLIAVFLLSRNCN